MAYVGPFAVFMLLLAVTPHLGLGWLEQPVWVVVVAAAIWGFSRNVLDIRPRRWLASIGVGVAVFVIWIGPDLLFPGYRGHWLFQNSILGELASRFPPDLREDALALVLRILRAVVLAPIVEELFWRGWLMRWLVDSEFEKVPLGAYRAGAFWITAALFAAEHGPFWDVGLLAGIAYNLWIIRTKKLADCILAHAVTNAILCAYVIASGKWQYWM